MERDKIDPLYHIRQSKQFGKAMKGLVTLKFNGTKRATSGSVWGKIGAVIRIHKSRLLSTSQLKRDLDFSADRSIVNRILTSADFKAYRVAKQILISDTNVKSLTLLKISGDEEQAHG